MLHPVPAATTLRNPKTLRHGALVRVTHWITVLCLFALLITGGEIVISHPRFYWGESGNVTMRPAVHAAYPRIAGYG